ELERGPDGEPQRERPKQGCAARSVPVAEHGRGHGRDGGQGDEATGETRPDAEARELAAGAVLLDGHPQPGRAEDAAAHLQVPAIPVAAGLDRSPRGAAALLEDRKPISRREPRLAPDLERPRKRRREPAVAATPPRGQAVVDATPVADERLDEREHRGDEPRPARPAQLGRPVGLDDVDAEEHEEERQREQERPPEGAERRQDPEDDHPLRLEEQRPDRRPRLVEALERRRPPDSVVDAPAKPEPGPRAAVDAAVPDRVAEGVVALGPLPLEQRL